MKDKLYGIIVRYFPDEFFQIIERHEKVGAYFFEVRDRDTDGKNIHASFFVYDDHPDQISIEINNVMNKSSIDEAGEVILKVLNDAIELREQYLRVSEHQKKLVDLEKIRKGEPVETKAEPPKEEKAG